MPVSSHQNLNGGMPTKEPYSQQWQQAVPDVAWGTLLLFVVVLVGYSMTISLTLSGELPEIAACFICAWLAYACFTIVHDAGHGSIFVSTHRLKPLEKIIGWIASAPLLVTSFAFFKVIHDRHHAHTNDPDRDPDHLNDKNWLTLFVGIYFIPIQYYVKSLTVYKNDPVCRSTDRSTIIYMLLVHGSLVTLMLLGFAKEVAIFAYIPMLITLFFLVFFFDYLPHYPHQSTDAFHNTRIYPSRLINWLLLGQNYHLVHHLHPKVPWYRYQQAFVLLRDQLAAKRSPIEAVSELLTHDNIGAVINDGMKLDGVLTVSKIQRLTTNAVAISFAAKLKFTAGQYVTVSKWLDGKLHTRCYSICSSSDEGSGEDCLTIGVKQVADGVVSNYLAEQLAVGDELIVKGPFGDFAWLPSDAAKPLTLVAAGSGITPILSMVKSALAFYKRHKGQDIERKIRLLYVNHDSDSVMFSEQLNALSAEYGAVFDYVSYYSKDEGRLTANMLKALLPVTDEDFYLCGPKGFIQIIVDYLDEQKVPTEQIFIEHFTPVLDFTNQTLPQAKVYQATLKQFGNIEHFEVNQQQTLLQGALAKNIAMNHACMNGTCGSCKCRLVEGKVEGEVEGKVENQGEGLSSGLSILTDKDIAAGFILACQSKPLSDVVVTD